MGHGGDTPLGGNGGRTPSFWMRCKERPRLLYTGGDIMDAVQNVFVLLKSDPKASSTELARFIARFPGMQEVWMTEGKYSFVARFSAPLESIPQLRSKILRNKAVLEVDCLPAPIVLK